MMIPAAFDYQDPADTERGWDDEDTRVDECVHGEHPIECSLCTSAGFIAAVSGEEETVTEEQDLQCDWQFEEWLKRASNAELRRGSFAIDREVAKRKADNAREAKELEQFEKPVRKQRSDAGTTRPRKTEAA